MEQKYIDLIVQMFVSDYSPEQVCSELRLCDPTDMSHTGTNQIWSNDINHQQEVAQLQVEEEVKGKEKS